MTHAFICDAIRTPFGRYGGALASVRADDLAAIPIKALVDRNPKVDWAALDDVIYGCANQAGEDNRNVARMALLLAGLPVEVPGATVNRLCGSGMEAVGQLARAVRLREAGVRIAGGVAGPARAPVAAGTAWGVNDGAGALIIASEAAAKRHGLTPRGRIVGMASAGVPPRIMGFGPAPASKKLAARLGIPISKMDVVELNEA